MVLFPAALHRRASARRHGHNRPVGTLPRTTLAAFGTAMTRLFIADIHTASGPRPLVTVRAASEAEALLFLEARYPDDRIAAVAEPAEWTSDAGTGSASGDIREHPGSTWPGSRQAPAGT